MIRISLFHALAIGVLSSANAAPNPIFPIVIPDGPDPLFDNLVIPGDADTRGMWSATQSWPLVGIHLVVMPDGRVLSFGTGAGLGIQDGRTLDLWDPTQGFAPASHLIIANGQSVDSFCGAAVLLPGTGKVFLAGGASNDGYPASASTVVTPELSTAVRTASTLAAQRWYGTMITLADGRSLMTGGGTPYALTTAYANPVAAQPNVSITPEIYSPKTGWTSLFGAASNDAFGPINSRGWYPRQWVAPSGNVFGISTDQMWSLDPGAGTIRSLGAFKTTVNLSTLPNVGPTSTAVMYDTGRIMQVGGNGYSNGYQSPSSPYATLFNITGGDVPVVTETSAMRFPRQWPNSLVLPDGTVLVTGGSTFGDNAGQNAVYAAEMWEPRTGRWTTGASAANYRGYHSTTALLPDGTVLSSGGGAAGPVTNLNAEIYYPPYLFTRSRQQTVLADRPRITSISAKALAYGSYLNVQMDDASAVSEVSLIGLSSVTHGFNTFQRRIKPVFYQFGSIVVVVTPASGNVAPPGYYLLTVSNNNGVPSAGTIVAVNATAPSDSAVTALLPVDNVARSLAASNYPGYVIRHRNFLGYLNNVGPASATGDKADASFFPRRGLASDACYSFESKNYPGYFLGQSDSRIKVLWNDGSRSTAGDLTFCAVGGLRGTGFTLQSFSKPDRFIRHRNFEIWLDQDDGSDLFQQDASFYLAFEDLPVDALAHSIANLANYGTALIRHQNDAVFLQPVNAAGLAGDIADSAFLIRKGNANAACYSFEAQNAPRRFVRQSGVSVQLASSDGSAQFANDSTFCPAAGLAGQGISLTANGSPNRYLRQNNSRLSFDVSDGSAQFNADATFLIVPVPSP